MALAAVRERPGVLGRLLSERLLVDRRAGLEALQELEAEAAPFTQMIVERLREPLLRCKTLQVLGSLGEATQPYMQTIIGHLGSPDTEVRVIAVNTLEKLQPWVGPEDVEAIAELTYHQDPRLRAAGIMALATLGEEKAGKHVEAIAEHITDDEVNRPFSADSSVAVIMQQADCAAVHALTKFGSRMPVA